MDRPCNSNQAPLDSRRVSRVLSEMHEYEHRTRKELIASIKEQAKELGFFFTLFLVYVLFGAIVFFYVEECSGASMAQDGSTPSLEDTETAVKFKNLTSTCNTLYYILQNQSHTDQKNITQFIAECKPIVQSSASPFITKGYTTSCKVDEFQMLKYAEYCIFTLLTVGYGNTTPVTIIGRYIMIMYAIFGVPIAVSMYSVAGKLLVQIFTFLVRFSEHKILGRPSCEKTLQVKVLLVSIFTMIAIMLLGSSIAMRDDMENWTFSTSIYFWFVSLTTIGYGDIHFNRLKHLESIHFLLISAGNLLFGLGISAAIIESFALALEKREDLVLNDDGETEDAQDEMESVETSVSSENMVDNSTMITLVTAIDSEDTFESHMQDDDEIDEIIENQYARLAEEGVSKENMSDKISDERNITRKRVSWKDEYNKELPSSRNEDTTIEEFYPSKE